jgi:hypothetical protein
MGGRHAVRLAAALVLLTGLTVLTTLTEGLSSQTPAAASVRSATAGVHQAAFEAVSCPRPKLCIAVGRQAAPHGQAPFAERWNGDSWKIQTIPAPKRATRSWSPCLAQVLEIARLSVARPAHGRSSECSPSNGTAIAGVSLRQAIPLASLQALSTASRALAPTTALPSACGKGARGT